MNTNNTNNYNVAVIGMSGRFPGANNVNDFWQNLVAEKDTIRHFSISELKEADVDESLLLQSNYVPARGILEDIDKFDADFFGISSKEASITDPQHRIFIEESWKALEAAGYANDRRDISIGVFAGMNDSDYYEDILFNSDNYYSEDLHKTYLYKYQLKIANSQHFLATKVGFYLNLRGPCVNIETACSTSLVSIVKACQSLACYECDIAMAGGISIHTPQTAGYLYQKEGILSVDGKCRAFDKNSTGTVISNGVGVVVLKRLEEALRDRDNIEAVVISAATNNDGNLKSSFIAPSVHAQYLCAFSAMGNLDSETISYVEAHGTGTILGDPIEITALSKAFSKRTDKKNFCAIGSVKTNIGHTDSASGVAGFIKTVMALKNRIIPASIHFSEPNPCINFNNSPFYVNTKTKEWDLSTNQGARRALVSSLGIGGTNAHIILEENTEKIISGRTRKTQVILLSAQTDSALIQQKEDLKNFLEKVNPIKDNLKFKRKELADIAKTLSLHRKSFFNKAAYVVNSAKDLIQALHDKEKSTEQGEYNRYISLDKMDKYLRTGKAIVFLFTGQGTIFNGAAQDLYVNEKSYKRYVDKCISYVDVSLQEDILKFIVGSAEETSLFSKQVMQQLILFIIEYSLAKTLMKYGIKPKAMLGHSLGEYVAATIAKVISLKDAIEIITKRGRLIDEMPNGSMLNVPMRSEEVSLIILGTNVSIAAINTAESCVISGPTIEVEMARKMLDDILIDKKLKCRFLDVKYAFHSQYMLSPAAKAYKLCLEKINYSLPTIAYISNLTGNWISRGRTINADYFVQHLLEPVLFSNGLKCLVDSGYDTFLEIGVGKPLIADAKKHDFCENLTFISTIPSKRELDFSNRNFGYLQDILAKCWVDGIQIRWDKYFVSEKRKIINLPTYPFKKNRYWYSDNKEIYANTSKPNMQNQTASQYFLYKPNYVASEVNANELVNEEINCIDKLYIIFCDEYGFSQKIIEILTEFKVQFIIVKNGDIFNSLEKDNTYIINFSDEADYSELYNILKYRNKLPNHLIHCAGLSHPNTVNFAESSVISTELQINNFFSLIYFARYFLEDLNSKNFCITIINNLLKIIVSSDRIIPEKSSCLALNKIFKQEYSNVLFKLIEFGIDDQMLFGYNAIDNSNSELSKKLFSEINDFSDDDLVFYRNNIRFKIDYFKYDLYKNPNLPKNNFLKQKGIYLITGGLGKVGIKLVKFLAKNYHAALIVTSRKNYQSDMLLQYINSKTLIPDQNSDFANNELLFEYNEILRHTHSFELLQCDISNYEEMNKIFAVIKTKYSKLDGIFHLAAVTGNSVKILIKNTTTASLNEQFLPKVQGLKVIRILCDLMPVGFCLSYSSISCIVGGVNLAAYAAANEYLDAISEIKYSNNSTKWLSINWDAINCDKTNFASLNSSKFISENCMLDILENYLNYYASHINRIIVSIGNIQNKLTALAIDNQAINRKNVSSNALDNQLSEIEIKSIIRSSFTSCLGIKDFNDSDSFFDLGGDSLIGMMLLDTLRDRLKFEIRLPDLIHHNTVSSLTSFFKQKHNVEGQAQWSFDQYKSGCILQLNKTTAKKQIFLFHAVTGTIFEYLDLVKNLSNKVICYGIQDPSLKEDKEIFDSIFSMARRYKSEMKNIQPAGPYVLCGFSFGATLAYEIATQLISEGEKVQTIFMIDGWATFSKLIKQEDTFEERIALGVNLINKFQALTSSNKENIINMCQDRMKMLFEYKPRFKLNVDIVLFKSADVLPEYREVDEHTNAWEAHFVNEVEVYSIQADHNTIMLGQAIRDISDVMLSKI